MNNQHNRYCFQQLLCGNHSSWWKYQIVLQTSELSSMETEHTFILEKCKFRAVRKPPVSLPSSVQFSHSVISNSLRPHVLQHARPPCLSPTSGVHSNSRPLSPWCYPAISSSVVPSSSCPQSLPASESFPMSQQFAWGGQSTGVSALASVLPKNTQDWSPLGWTGWISLQSKGLSYHSWF